MFTKLAYTLPAFYGELCHLLDLANLRPKGTPLGRYIIAGGSISNHYINEMTGSNHPVKDIDVFFEGPEELFMKNIHELTGEAPIDQTIEWTNAYGDSCQGITSCHFSFKGLTVEVVFCPVHRVLDFDLRFRMFYLYKGEVFAHNQALEDIRKRELVLMNPKSPISTLIRMKRFSTDFAFTVTETSRKYLYWYIKRSYVTYAKLSDAATNSDRLNRDEKEHLLRWGRSISDGERLSPAGDYPFHPETEDLLYRYIPYEPLLGLYYDDLLSYQPFSYEPFRSEMPHSGFDEAVRPIYDALKTIEEKQPLRLGLMLDFDLDGIDPSTLYKHRRKLIGNLLVDEIIKRFKRYIPYVRTFWQAHVLPDFITPRVGIPLDLETSFGDVITQNTLAVHVDDEVVLNLRRCTNGRYTLSHTSVCADHAATLYTRDLIEVLKTKWPWTEFHNPELQGVFAYSPDNYSNHYYFLFESDEFLFDHLKLEKLVPIRNITKPKLEGLA